MALHFLGSVNSITDIAAILLYSELTFVSQNVQSVKDRIMRSCLFNELEFGPRLAIADLPEVASGLLSCRRPWQQQPKVRTDPHLRLNFKFCTKKLGGLRCDG